MAARNKNLLPQEGTGGSGESLPGPGPGCPTFSGRGKILRTRRTTTTKARKAAIDPRNKTTTKATRKRTNDLPMDRRPPQETLLEATVATAFESEVPATGSRRRDSERSHSDSSSSEDSDAASGVTGHCSPSSQHARSRPPTTGHYVGLAKAQADLNRLKAEELRCRVEQEQIKPSSRIRRVRAPKDVAVPALEDQTAFMINEGMQAQMDTVLNVVQTSKNLGVVYRDALEEAAVSIADAATQLANLYDTEVIRSLRAECESLRAKEKARAEEIDGLRKDLTELKATL